MKKKVTQQSRIIAVTRFDSSIWQLLDQSQLSWISRHLRTFDAKKILENIAQKRNLAEVLITGWF